MIGKLTAQKRPSQASFPTMIIQDALMKTLAIWSVVLCFSLVSRPGVADDQLRSLRHRHACDLALEEGVLSVQLVNTKGEGVSNVTSILRYRGRPLAILATDSSGLVSFRHLTAGLYELNVGSRMEFIRVWEKDSAPKAAWKKLVRIQDGDPIGIAGPFAVIELMGPGGAPAPLTPDREKLVETCRAADIRILLSR